MSTIIANQQYGKDKVRLVKVTRLPPDPAAPHLKHQIVTELTVRVLLSGDFDASYEKADNSLVVPTDTVKNTIYILAKKSSNPTLQTPELFARELSLHFLSKYSHISSVDVLIESHNWTRIQTTTFSPVSSSSTGTAFPTTTTTKEHPHSFYRAGEDKRVVRLVGTRTSEPGKTLSVRYTLTSGLKDLYVLKTTGSSFENFHKCENTTLPEMADRIFSTNIDATWSYGPLIETVGSGKSHYEGLNFDKFFAGVKQMTLDIFANHDSPSVQNTLYRIGDTVLKCFREVAEVSFVLPNKHAFLYDLERFGLPNKGDEAEVFYPVADPSGYISATITRKQAHL
ncbi:hypothetical protein HK097_005855 [Rhizophlyctis rosea]|uniref:Uricase n=1 Tax=Rhizophlyctis rosea TaxID=64517 RepID=A0AAD5S087_9FUNG|nr:hypothetical protein HK097_005855 [Rhizophlyctis rosea]